VAGPFHQITLLTGIHSKKYRNWFNKRGSNYRDLIPGFLGLEDRLCGQHLFIGCSISIAKESISCMPDIDRRPSPSFRDRSLPQSHKIRLRGKALESLLWTKLRTLSNKSE